MEYFHLRNLSKGCFNLKEVFYGRCEEEEEGDEEEIRFTPQVSRVSNNLWSDILWNATNGKVSRDYLTGTYYQ